MTTSPKNKSVLLIEDEYELREILTLEMQEYGLKVSACESGNKAIEFLKRESIDLIISDIRMPDGGGVHLLDTVRVEKKSLIPFIVISGYSDLPTEDAYAKGADLVLGKPFKVGTLLDEIVSKLLPFEDRCSRVYHYPDLSAVTIPVEKTTWGRSGFSFRNDSVLNKHQPLQIQLVSSGNTSPLSGLGIVRWSLDNGETGVEWISILPNSLKSIAALLKTGSTASIPRCTH
jgi:CheY-like chemotaxis protein